jgi:hypothetical protein
MQFWGTYQGFRESGSLTSKLKQTFYYPNNSTPQTDPMNLFSKNPLLIEYQSERRSYRERNY